MNRAERRRAKKTGIPIKREPVVNIKAADVQKIKQDALARFAVNGSPMRFLNCMTALKKVMCPLKIFT